MTDETGKVTISVKWSKKNFDILVTEGLTGLDLKQQVLLLTGVPIERQKLLGGIGWKGPLRDEFVFDHELLLRLATQQKTSPLKVTLIGTAETLSRPSVQTTFLEDLSPEQLRAQELQEQQAAMKDAIGMIPALQLQPHHREDGKQQQYSYNRLVTGLPQRQIEQDLSRRHGESISGKLALTLGMEMRRAYVNELAVLTDGTCVSAMDDGHIQLWKHAAQQHDIVLPGSDGGVDSVVALENSRFASAGRGYLRIWSGAGEPIVDISSSIPGTSPDNLVLLPFRDVTCVAARLKVTRVSNTSLFRLQPQDEAQRRRRAAAEAQEQAIQHVLTRATRTVQIWFKRTLDTSSIPSLQSKVLEPPQIDISSAVTSLCVTSDSDIDSADGSVLLFVGDASGGIRLWRLHSSHGGDVTFHHLAYYTLRSVTPDQSLACSIVCLRSLEDSSRIAISTSRRVVSSGEHGAADSIVELPSPHGVHILSLSHGSLKLQKTLNGHKHDAVICICALPNGDLLTGGGKLDATTQLWRKDQISPTMSGDLVVHKSHSVLEKIGYVFDMVVLPDMKRSALYAVATARYNRVNIFL